MLGPPDCDVNWGNMCVCVSFSFSLSLSNIEIAGAIEKKREMDTASITVCVCVSGPHSLAASCETPRSVKLRNTHIRCGYPAIWHSPPRVTKTRKTDEKK